MFYSRNLKSAATHYNLPPRPTSAFCRPVKTQGDIETMLGQRSNIMLAVLISIHIRGFSTHRQLLEVDAFQAFMEMLWYVLPGWKPAVSLLLPSHMVVFPTWGGECSPYLKHGAMNGLMTQSIETRLSLPCFLFQMGNPRSEAWPDLY